MLPLFALFGQRPEDITAWATLVLAFVGATGIITATILAVAAVRQAAAAKAANEQQRREMELLREQVLLTRADMAMRAEASERDRELAERHLRANLEMEAGCSYTSGSPPTNVCILITITNNGPGVASRVVCGVERRQGVWERKAAASPTTLAVGQSTTATVMVPDADVLDCSFFPTQRDPMKSTFRAWVVYEDGTGKSWEKRQGQTSRKITRHERLRRARSLKPNPQHS